MADNVAITAGSGTTIATDDVSSVHYQIMKLADGTLNSSTLIAGTAAGLYSLAHRDLVAITVTSSGLTTSTTAYSSGDQVGAQMTFAGAARSSGGSGTVAGALLVDKADIIGGYDLIVSNASITPASDNAAFAISDADALTALHVLSMAAVYDIGNNRLAQLFSCSFPYTCAATSLFGNLMTRSAHTFFGATSDLQVTLFVELN